MERRKAIAVMVGGVSATALVGAGVAYMVGEGMGFVDTRIQVHPFYNPETGLVCDEARIYTYTNSELWGEKINLIQGRIKVNGEEVVPYSNWLTPEQLPHGAGTGQHHLPTEEGAYEVEVSVRAQLQIGETNLFIARQQRKVTLECKKPQIQETVFNSR